MAMLLSSLRVFTDRIGAKKMEHPTQDAVLHIFSLLTRFPPAVRAVHILMNGKSPRACERAALAQALYEVLKGVVPLQLVKSDMTRLFEGARLLFGLILEKAKHLKLREDTQMPYISSLKVIDLRNTFTMEPLLHPIQTPFGLVEEGYYEAFKEGGILYWKTGEQPLAALPLDERTRRVSLLSGGLVSQLTVLDWNALKSIAGYANKGEADVIIPPRELSDLSHLSALCSRNDLSVLAPSTLPSAEAPALTLDREGLLAVYVGRAPCAQPGKDISIFRPMKGGEETIDVAIITQLLVPILEQREADGTAIFDAFGDGFQRKFKAPDEIIMVCVDCSSSMSENSDFMEIRDSDSEGDESDDSDMDTNDDSSQTNNAADGSSYFCATLDEMKKSITEHESFTDMLYIVHDSAASKRRDVACKVMEILSVLASQELSKSLRRLEDLKQRVTIAYYRVQAANFESEITKLKTFTAGLNVHRQALADFLIYRSSNMEVFDDQWKWALGNAIPKIPKKLAEKSDPLVQEQFSVPDDFLCPISREVMDDPVLASDGFTFERNAIER
jgi:U-box domain